MFEFAFKQMKGIVQPDGKSYSKYPEVINATKKFTGLLPLAKEDILRFKEEYGKQLPPTGATSLPSDIYVLLVEPIERFVTCFSNNEPSGFLKELSSEQKIHGDCWAVFLRRKEG